MGLQQTVPPNDPPVSLVRAKLHLKVDEPDDDLLISDLINAATTWGEDYTHRKFITQTWELTLDRFPTGAPGIIELPFGNTQSITQISYIDAAGATQTLTGPSTSPPGTDWQEDLSSDNGGIIAPPFGGSWPSARGSTLGAVTITFVTGYGDDAEDVPESLVRAMLYRLSDFYELRSSLDIAQPAFADDLQDTAARVADEFVIRRFQ
jgi:uncharacterized phiE125 gp8 family phage protein